MRIPKSVIRRAVPGFCFALICNASLGAPAGIQTPSVPLQDRSDPLIEARATLVTALPASGAGLQDPSIPPEIAIDVFQVYSLPVAISSASLRKTKRGDLIKFVIANSSNEQILGFRYWLLVVDSANKVRRATDQSEGLKLDAYAAKAVSFPSPPRLKAAADDRVFLVLAQVIGRDSIWEVQQAKNALLAYVKGDSYTMPSVLRLLNQVDSPIGFAPMFLRPKPKQ
jgi:hypothetical protein